MILYVFIADMNLVDWITYNLQITNKFIKGN